MSIDSMIEPMLSVPFFEHLAIGHLKALAIGAERRVFEDGDALLTTGADGHAAYLVVDGRVRSKLGGAAESGWTEYGTGTLLGEMAMLTEVVHATTVRAIGTVRVLVFSRHMMHGLFAEDPSLAQHFLDVLTGRLTAYSDALRQADAVLANDTGAARWVA